MLRKPEVIPKILPRGVQRGLLLGRTEAEARSSFGGFGIHFRELTVTQRRGYVVIDIYWWHEERVGYD